MTAKRVLGVSKKSSQSAQSSPASHAPSMPSAPSAPEQRYRAGCGRTWSLASRVPDLAYTDLAFPECPTCPERISPQEDTAAFCTLRPEHAPHPFAALAAFRDQLADDPPVTDEDDASSQNASPQDASSQDIAEGTRTSK